MKKVIITGGAGFVGTKLTEALLARGYSVHVLDRSQPRIEHAYLTFTVCDIATMVPAGVLEDAFGIINLAGRTIAGRWTPSIKKEIYDSRILTTKNIVDAIATTSTRPSVLVSASAVGYYGDTGETLVDETAPSGTDFLATVARDWEGEALRAESLGVRVALVRTAHVIGGGGLVATLEKVFSRHMGGFFGNGKQYMPWVSLEDVIEIYIFLLEHENARGPFNTAAGTPLTQKEFMRVFATTKGYWPLWRIPAFAARLVLGEFAGGLLKGQKITSAKLQKVGFVFHYSTLAESLKTFK